MLHNFIQRGIEIEKFQRELPLYKWHNLLLSNWTLHTVQNLTETPKEIVSQLLNHCQ